MSDPEFIRLQRAFTDHLRDPETKPPPGVHEERRMAIYRHAVYANSERFLRDNFPRVCAVMSVARWQGMVRDYLVRHVAGAAAFVDLPCEFLAYLQHQRVADLDPPFLYELAHFDWLETLIGADERRLDLGGIDPDGDLIDGVPVANPILCMVNYRFPVHAIDANYQPSEPPPTPTRIAAFRDPGNLYGFLDLNDAAARLLELVIENRGRRGGELVESVALELGRADVAPLIAAAGTILARMKARGALLGTLRSVR